MTYNGYNKNLSNFRPSDDTLHYETDTDHVFEVMANGEIVYQVKPDSDRSLIRLYPDPELDADAIETLLCVKGSNLLSDNSSYPSGTIPRIIDDIFKSYAEMGNNMSCVIVIPPSLDPSSKRLGITEIERYPAGPKKVFDDAFVMEIFAFRVDDKGDIEQVVNMPLMVHCEKDRFSTASLLGKVITKESLIEPCEKDDSCFTTPLRKEIYYDIGRSPYVMNRYSRPIINEDHLLINPNNFDDYHIKAYGLSQLGEAIVEYLSIARDHPMRLEPLKGFCTSL